VNDRRRNHWIDSNRIAQKSTVRTCTVVSPTTRKRSSAEPAVMNHATSKNKRAVVVVAVVLLFVEIIIIMIDRSIVLYVYYTRSLFAIVRLLLPALL